ncbi:MAG: DUF2782 domain-containing protein [Magnetococcales bacterium]|nr:DUF2782 domain-containing protein [Magnetococcales bacterium]NGZ05923.1 DUF2782 domain-containing protein [Magnetococcales bacterium]
MKWITPLFVVPLLTTAWLLVAADARAEATGTAHPVPAKGPLVSELREQLDPDHPQHETVIRKYEDAQGNQVREFLANGSLYQIEVVPVNGPAYYLIDTDGDGLFETRSHGHEPQIVVPQWVLFRY